MSLSRSQSDYLEHELTASGRKVLDEYYKGEKSFENADPISTGLSVDQGAAIRIRRLAEDLVSARASTYIEVFRKLGKFPTPEDQERFLEVTRTVAIDRALEMFEEACADIFAKPAHKTIAKAIRSSLPNELEAIFARGIGPVRSFFLEGRAIGETEMPDKRSVVQIEEAYLIALYEVANREAYEWVETMLVQKAAGLSEKEMELAIVRLKEKGWAKFTYGRSYLTGDGLNELETRQQSQSNREPKATGPSYYYVEGDLVTGNQSKTGSITNTFHGTVGAVQQGDENVAHVAQKIGIDLSEVAELLERLRDSIIPEHQEAGTEYIDLLEDELKKNEPKESRIRLFLKGVGGIATEAGKVVVGELTKKLLSGETPV